MYDILIGGSILAALYYLVLRGYLFRGIIWLFGFYGLAITLDRIPLFHQAPVLAFTHPVSWAYFISFFIALAAIITTKYSTI